MCFRTQLDKLTNKLQQLFLNCDLSLDLIETLRDLHLTSSQMNKQYPCLYSQQVISALIGSAVSSKSQGFDLKLLYANCICVCNDIVKVNII